MVERRQAFRGIDLLMKAITKIQLHPAQLTSIHADLCQLCLLAKCVKPALTFLDIDITEISKEVIITHPHKAIFNFSYSTRLEITMLNIFFCIIIMAE